MLQLLTFRLIYVTMNSQNVLLWLGYKHEKYASLVNAITDNALFHSSSHIRQMLSHIANILRFCLVDMFPQIL